jgi:hypothetical protein
VLPNAEHAVIPAGKLRDYLLSASHAQGRFKASVFGALGYTVTDWQRLAADLREQHLSLDAREERSTEHGRKFVIRGPLAGPNGRTREMISVWIIDRGEDTPRFVTAYPAGRRS